MKDRKGYKSNVSYYFVQDSNTLLAVALGLSSFLLFKNLKISYTCMGSVAGIFIVCVLIDRIRIICIEQPFLDCLTNMECLQDLGKLFYFVSIERLL